jgi:hypothetical protein
MLFKKRKKRKGEKTSPVVALVSTLNPKSKKSMTNSCIFIILYTILQLYTRCVLYLGAESHYPFFDKRTTSRSTCCWPRATFSAAHNKTSNSPKNKYRKEEKNLSSLFCQLLANPKTPKKYNNKRIT